MNMNIVLRDKNTNKITKGSLARIIACVAVLVIVALLVIAYFVNQSDPSHAFLWHKHI